MGIYQNFVVVFRKDKKLLLLIAGMFLLVFVCVGVIYHWAENQAITEQEKAFNSQQSLQILLARQAMEDYFRDLFADTKIMAEYSIVQYKKLNLPKAFMLDQLAIGARVDPQYLAIYYLESPEQVDIEASDPGQNADKLRGMALTLAGSYWETARNSTTDQLPVIPPFHISQNEQWIGMLYPVRVDGIFRGELVAISDLRTAIDRFVVPLRSGQYGAAYLVDGRGNILFDHETQIIGQNIFNGMHSNYPDVQRFDRLITSQNSGVGEYHFTVERGGEVNRKLSAWDSLPLGSEKLIIVLSAPSSEIDANLVILRRQRDLINITLVFGSLVVMGLFFRARQHALERYTVDLQSEVTDRSKALVVSQEALLASNETLQALIDMSPLPITTLDAAGNVCMWNPAAESMFGYTAAELIGKPNPIVPDDRQGEYQSLSNQVLENGRLVNIETVRRRKDGSQLHVLISTARLYTPDGKIRGRMAIFTDISVQKRREEETRIDQARLNIQVRIAQQKADTVKELLDIGLEEALALTASKVGYIYYYDEGRAEFILHAWSKDVMAECSILQPASIYHLSEVGIWGEVVRQRRAIIVNDFQAPHPLKKGYPAGHVELFRFMSLPVFNGEQIVAVVGMGNKATDYTDVDLHELGLLMDSIWKVAGRKEIEEKLRQNNARLVALDRFSQAMATGLSTDFQGTVDRVTRFAAELTGDYCFLAVFDPKLQAYKARSAWSIDPGVMQFIYTHPISPNFPLRSVFDQVIRTSQPVSMTETGTGWIEADLHVDAKEFYKQFQPRSLVVLPLNAQGRIIGAMMLVRIGNRPAITATEDPAFLQELSNRAALTIANADLYAENQRKLEHFQSLHSIEVAITSSLDVSNTLTMIVNQVVGQLHADAADIVLLRQQTQRLEFAAGCGFCSGTPVGMGVRMGEGLVGRVAREGQMLAIPQLSDTVEMRLPDYITREGFVTYYGLPLIARGQLKGVLEVYQRDQLTPDQEWLDILQTLGGQAAIAIDHAALFEDLQRSNFDLSMAYDETIEGLSRALDLRDNDTEGHSRRVSDLTERLAYAFRIPEMGIIHIRRGALLHDIGKMGIPDKILLKAGPLDDEEWAVMHKHPRYAYDILFPIHHLRPSLDIPYCHHEKWDGTGYPRGLKGTEIPLAARMFAVVDVFDALTSHRPYRPAWTQTQALKYIRAQAGLHFDPDVVRLFMEIMEA